ncbi:MAG: hypothetical protein RL194_825 [Pseudomonadota bacterium]
MIDLGEKEFVWLNPPYFEPVGQDDANDCLIYLQDGEKHFGKLNGLKEDPAAIEFLSTAEYTPRLIDLAEVKMIRLVKPSEFSKKSYSIESRADSFHAPSERQTFRIEFNDKQILKGETLGFVAGNEGLFLFPVKNEFSVIRYFFPFAAMQSYQIGEKIGQILVDEKLADQRKVDEALNEQVKLRSQKVGSYLTEHKIINAEQLHQAIKHQEGQPVLKLGEALLQLGLIDQKQLRAALEQQKANRSLQLGQILINMHIIDSYKLKEVLAKKMGIPFVGLANFNFQPDATKLIDASVARRFPLIPLCLEGNKLVIALEDPLNIEALKYVKFLTQKIVIPAMALREEIVEAINRTYNENDASAPLEFTPRSEYMLHDVPATPQTRMDELTQKLSLEQEDHRPLKEVAVESDSALVKIVDKMILDAADQGVSDIHIEGSARGKSAHVRFRKDGSLFLYTDIPAKFKNALISRIKVMAQLDISEKRKPQDGKINFNHGKSRHLELRVATIPTNNNTEDVVLRLLESAKPVSIEHLGLAPAMRETLGKIITRPHGLILVCGPTGSGKTTTLHSLIHKINTPDKKIWTAEDPVEITQPGLSQVQINPKIGLTFEVAMRSFLRADPDIIMVGEIRDRETADIVIEGSLTGHLVFSTIHTNSATETLIRLLDLDIDPFNFADALQAILAQRLVKSLCKQCRAPYAASDEELNELADEYCTGTDLEAARIRTAWAKAYGKDGKLQLFKAAGCPHCKNSGFAGRIGIHELLVIDDELKRLIHKRASTEEMLKHARAHGMLTLKQDGILKVLSGITQIAQIRALAV